ncbi:hypothetical protein AVEN_143126-1 [Araneus ventricosus]|uniref:Uncharacterized protein n=1 Tax=Araneus ventricosus TaxID=182803 RepID=A0A4Y2Q9X3_ARAVE|nr:hypothetical protein AVEN_143126-1 [Araneus ventricosus]
MRRKLLDCSSRHFCTLECEECIHRAVIALAMAEKADLKSAFGLFECLISLLHVRKPTIHPLLQFSKSFPCLKRSRATERQSSFWSVENCFGSNLENMRLVLKSSIQMD